MGFDDVFEYIGGLGIYQVCIYLLLGLPSFYGGYQSMAMTFLGPKHEHWCKVDRLKNLSNSQQRYIAIPYNEERDKYDHCHYYVLPYDRMDDEQLEKWNWTTTYNDSDRMKTAPCEEWTFDQDEYTFSALSKYSLVCDRSYLVSLVYCSYTTSTIIANLIAGPVSDRFGRKTLLLVAVCFEGLLGVLAAYAPNYPAFLVMRFLMALSISLASTCCFVLSMEIFGPQYRAIAGGLYWLFWSFGFLTLPCVALFVKDFRKLQIVLAAPMFVTLCYFLTVSESPRWLISQNKIAQAKKVISLIAKVNRKQVPDDIDDMLHQSPPYKERVSSNHDKTTGKLISGNSDTRDAKTIHMNAFDILKIPILRNHILFIMPGWISCTLIYYGMSYNTGSIVGNVYINTFLSGLVEVPAYITSIPLMYKLGRRYSQIGTLIISGSACFICIPFLNSGNSTYDVIVITLMMIGKAAITMAFAVIFVYTAELFPTPVRHAAVAIPYMTGNIFGLASPFMGEHMMAVWRPLPLVIFGTLGILSGLLVFLLPETRDGSLADNICDIQAMETSGRDILIKSEQEDLTFEEKLTLTTGAEVTAVDLKDVKYQPLREEVHIDPVDTVK